MIRWEASSSGMLVVVKADLVGVPFSLSRCGPREALPQIIQSMTEDLDRMRRQLGGEAVDWPLPPHAAELNTLQEGCPGCQ
ncbi:TPA: hypothetical protein NH744_001591 [Pseudomonas aeruginosa]|nr:hypothetical protein [Pseudomonas aeruginosa]